MWCSYRFLFDKILFMRRFDFENHFDNNIRLKLSKDLSGSGINKLKTIFFFFETLLKIKDAYVH